MDEYTTWTIDNDSTADWAIRKIAQAQAEYDRLAELAKQRKAEIDGELADAAARRDNAISPLEAALCAYFAGVKPSTDTKTQTTYRLLSGTLVQKKPKQAMVVEGDGSALLRWMEGNGYGDMVNRTPQWGSFKRCLQISGAVAVDSSTGAVVDGVAAEETPGKFEVKPKGGL
ncbi:MAG: host-nuclease inhibitor Gam family protein [Clostridiales bacterium]|nr:host-nuclease inhibitor Gam family protein [Clostridiales bacterium]